MERILALYTLGVVTFVGCASYTASPAPIPIAGAMPAWQTVGSVAIGADPYVQQYRQALTFNANFNRAGVLAIQVFVKNEGSHRLLVQRSEIALVLPSGNSIRPARKTAVVDLVASAAVYPPVYVPAPPPRVTGPGQGPGTEWSHLGSVSGAAFSMVFSETTAKNKNRAGRLADYRRKELKDVTLGKSEAVYGFVYFIPPPETGTIITEATLTVTVVDLDEATRFVVRLPLTELGFSCWLRCGYDWK